ncbi:MAG: tRNA (adenosine(37)-N6)-threonylcarbamoyltransferase complex dimerization subunit type 1 TsaB [Bacteroidetes bacterium]|jgi:tRNA threonylcarbamoyladenosine biosynthesis protein TsaB|nr:tRNA (adenosine(37)-N6)-threonylcarbamoyltransferase complex dimerization subunit type 1 TsaB [Bacteroidota bacterium]
MAYFIGIETGTNICSVALFEQDKVIELREAEGRVHSEKTAVYLKQCLDAAGLKPSDIAAVGVSIGPGSYTGLRVGLSIAKGFCYGLDIPLLAIDSLEILAAGSIQAIGPERQGIHCPMIDARRMEVYAALYAEEGKEIIPARSLILESQGWKSLLGNHSPVFLSGDGASKAMTVDEIAARAVNSGVRASAQHMGGLLWKAWSAQNWASIAYTTPKYLKKPNITRSKKTLL